MSSVVGPKYLQEEESLSLPPECKQLISTLPTKKAWLTTLYQYQGFWYPARYLPGVIACQNHFQCQDSDVFLVTTPKSGTTWLKAITFTLLNRHKHPPEVNNLNHPLVSNNPHQLLPLLETTKIHGGSDSDSEIRLLPTHIPCISLPESVKSNSKCKFLYLCRDPKDNFVSLWHFCNKLGQLQAEDAADSMAEDFELFCRGVSGFGPCWDHALGYWKLSQEKPDRALFLKYEEMKERPEYYLRRLAEFLDCPLTAEEEESGVGDSILRLCSFDNLSSLNVNKNEALPNGMKNSVFFRKGKVGDWENHLTAEMASKLDQITTDKFHGSGLVL